MKKHSKHLAMLKVKEDELQQDISRKENVVKRIKEVRKYFNKTSISPITHLYDIDHIMKESLNLKVSERNYG